MIRTMRENLTRQRGALGVLAGLLEEEFSLLREGKPQEVTRLELAIQELIRQVAAERAALKALVVESHGRAIPMSEVAAAFGADDARVFGEILSGIDALEQDCARQAEKNSHLALALYDQSKEMIDFLHEQVKPRRQDVYARNGRFVSGKTQASLMRGSL